MIMENSAKIGIIGAVLFFVGLIGFVMVGYNALPSLMERDYNAFQGMTMWYVVGFGLIGLLGFMVWMIGVALGQSREK
jgi:uncharacterized membrane protein